MLAVGAPRIAGRRSSRVAKELGGARTDQLAQGGDLAKDIGRQVARDSREMSEHERGRDRVVERAMRGVGHDRRVGREPLQGVARCGWQEDRGELGGIERFEVRGHPRSLEEGHIEAHVVANETWPPLAERERYELSHRLRRRRRVSQVVIAYPGKPQDGRGQRTAGICKRQESLAESHSPVRRHGQADRADLDDLFALGLVPGGLEVDRDQDPVHGSPI